MTRIGAVLRRYKLDELPQLWNVLCGEMSLVGPRPEVQRFVDLYTEEEKAILTVRPGLTDWASLWNIDEGAILEGSADPDRAYCELIRPKNFCSSSPTCVRLASGPISVFCFRPLGRFYSA